MKGKIPVPPKNGKPTVVQMANMVVEKRFGGQVSKLQYGMIYNVVEELFDFVLTSARIKMHHTNPQTRVEEDPHIPVTHFCMVCPKCKQDSLPLSTGKCEKCNYLTPGYEDLDNS